MDILKKHRVIGIRHCLSHLKRRGLVSKGINYPADAATELAAVQKKAESARRHRTARRDASPIAVRKMLAGLAGVPVDAIQLVYPSGRKLRSDSDIGKLRRSWENK